MASAVSMRAFARSLHHLPRRKVPIPARWVGSRRTAATYTSPRQAAQISIIQSAVDTDSARYRDNASSMGELTSRLTTLHAEAAQGGSEKARQKHVERGKMLVRDRVTALIDPGTSFLELSSLAGHELYDGEGVPGAGMVTGIGTVEGVMCMIIANDSTYVAVSSDCEAYMSS
jgi:3-methylcrotonyl-CoA carboxylase beta subunit